MIESHARKIEKKLEQNFNDKQLLVNAFVHRSFLNENRSFPLPSNERLEFLGDACLELIVSRYLFDQYPKQPEGKLTNYRSALVNTQSLAKTAKRLKLGDFLLLSYGEEEGGGRESEYILANTFEAFLGALYLDQGYQKAQQFVQENLLPKITEIIKNRAYKDSKSHLQEILQAKEGVTPVYKVLEDWGPDHDKTFRVGVFAKEKKIGEGVGSSKQKAELRAAENGLKELT